MSCYYKVKEWKLSMYGVENGEHSGLLSILALQFGKFL
jgi:hypothetical protein